MQSERKVRNRGMARAKALAKERDDQGCVVCARGDTFEVHHVVKLRNGSDEYNLDNLVTCRDHHRFSGVEMASGADRGDEH